MPRQYPEKKATLYHRYTRLLDSSATATLVFLLHADFSAQRLVKLRKDIIVAAGHPPPSLAGLSPNTTEPPRPLPTLTILRTSVFGAALRDFTNISTDAGQQIADLVQGGLAVLALPDMDPPQLNAVLRTLDRTVPPRKPKTKAELEKQEKEKNADPAVPGRRVKRMRPILQPELKVVGALVEGRLFTVDGLRDVSKLPPLGTLRAQIVGLLSAPAAQLVAVMGQAGGGKLVRTLEGLKSSMTDSTVS